MKIKLNKKGVSHHFLLPVLVVFMVAGIGGYVMLKASSAATLCRSRSFGYMARSECVRYAQRMVGADADAVLGKNTQARLKAKTGYTSLTPSTGWKALCSSKFSNSASKKAACDGKGIAKNGNPTVGYRVCVKRTYKDAGKNSNGSPNKPNKMSCATHRTYKGVGSYNKAKKAVDAYKQSSQYKAILSQYKSDQAAYKNYYPTYRIKSAPTFSIAPVNFGTDTR